MRNVLKETLEYKHMTVKELSKKAYMTTQSIYNIMNSKCYTNYVNRKIICDILDESVDKIFFE